MQCIHDTIGILNSLRERYFLLHFLHSAHHYNILETRAESRYSTGGAQFFYYSLTKKKKKKKKKKEEDRNKCEKLRAMPRHGSFDATDEKRSPFVSRLIKRCCATWPRNGVRGRCSTQRGEFPDALRELTLIHLARRSKTIRRQFRDTGFAWKS